MSHRSHVVFPLGDGFVYGCEACDWQGTRSGAAGHVVEHQYRVAPSKTPLGPPPRRRRPRQ